MITVAEARAWGARELSGAEIKSSALTSDLLLASVLGCDRVRILSHPEQAVPQDLWERFRIMVEHRAAGVPLQYLTGEQEFYGLSFHVAPGVLIPRPETEILVEKALSLIRSRPDPESRFLDIGTGSGCIAIAVAHEIPRCRGWAVDISREALEIARGNAERHRVADRLLLVQSNLCRCFPPDPTFDFIFCNPPYVASNDCDSLPLEVRDHEPHTALFGGESGMELYRELIPEVPARLTPGGYLLLELGAGQAQDVQKLVVDAGLIVEAILPDLQGIPRCLVGRNPQGVSHG